MFDFGADSRNEVEKMDKIIKLVTFDRNTRIHSMLTKLGYLMNHSYTYVVRDM